tara:strand:- start:195 stop:572 length:378 start_codon:yes stop_codon:yes gene_type:complete
MFKKKESSKINLLEGEESFINNLKRTNQVKVNLNEDELASLNELVKRFQSDKSSVLRMLLNSQMSKEKDITIVGSHDEIVIANKPNPYRDTLPIKYLEELKEIFEKSLINEEEYKALKLKALGLD